MTKRWKRVTIIFSTVFALGLMAMAPVTRVLTIKDALYSSIVWIESKGNPNARSKDGSLGVVQIRPVMVKEVNRICKIEGINKRFTLEDRKNPKKSEEMFWIFQGFYHPEIDMDSLSLKDAESLARTWNGGPNGNRIKSTKKYWHKVAKRFNKELEERSLTMLAES